MIRSEGRDLVLVAPHLLYCVAAVRALKSWVRAICILDVCLVFDGDGSCLDQMT